MTLSQASPTPVTINYTTADGSASGDADYAPVTGTITFAANQTTPQTISVPIIGDTVKEIDEQFTLKLSIPTTKDSKGQRHLHRAGFGTRGNRNRHGHDHRR